MGKEHATDRKSHWDPGMEDTALRHAGSDTSSTSSASPSSRTSASSTTTTTGSGSTSPLDLGPGNPDATTDPPPSTRTFRSQGPAPFGLLPAISRSHSQLGTEGSGKLDAPNSPSSTRLILTDPKIVDSRMEYLRKAITRGRQRRASGPQQHQRGPTDFRGVFRFGGFLTLLLAAGSKPSHGHLSDQPDSRAPLPFAYERSHDIRNQKVVFNPVGQYATDVSFIHAKIRMPFKHIIKVRYVIAHSKILALQAGTNSSECTARVA